jgi:hypothetical protein
LLTRILQMALTITAISAPERGRVELGLLKRMCTSAACLLLVVAVFSVGLRSEAIGMDLASSLGLTESFEMRRLPLQVLEGSMVLTPQRPMERYDEGAIIASCLPLPMLVLRQPMSSTQAHTSLLGRLNSLGAREMRAYGGGGEEDDGARTWEGRGGQPFVGGVGEGGGGFGSIAAWTREVKEVAAIGAAPSGRASA